MGYLSDKFTAFQAKFEKPNLSNETKLNHTALNVKDGLTAMGQRIENLVTFGEAGGAGSGLGKKVGNAATGAVTGVGNMAGKLMQNKVVGSILLLGGLYAAGKWLVNKCKNYFTRKEIDAHHQAADLANTKADTLKLQAAEQYMASDYGPKPGMAENHWRNLHGGNRGQGAPSQQHTYH